MADFLPSAIESVLSQDFQDFELLILDDGSTDATRSVLNDYQTSPRIRLFSSSKRKGIPYSRNMLLEKARGTYFCILDADDLWLEYKLQHQLELYEKHPDTQVLWGSAWQIHLNGEPARLLPTNRLKPNWIENYQVVHSTTAWRTQTLKQLGGYNLNFPTNESIELFFRISELSSPLFDPLPVTIQRKGKDASRGKARKNMNIFEILSLPHSRINSLRE